MFRRLRSGSDSARSSKSKSFWQGRSIERVLAAKRGRRLGVEMLEDRRMLAVITVNSALDNILGGNGLVTLREAIIAANTDGPTDGGGTGSGADTIVFAPGLNGASILLNHQILGALPTITESLTIDASALASGLTINGNDPSPAAGDGVRIFNIDDGAAGLIDVTLNGLTLTGGDVIGLGGAVRSLENLTIIDSTISGNRASSDGGGIAQLAGELSISSSTISGNSTATDGGGVYSTTTGNVTIANSTVSGNSASDNGGGIYIQNSGFALITSSTVSDNDAANDGGGVYLNTNSAATITNSTISGNRAADNGGGLFLDADAGEIITVRHSTITQNVSNFGSVGGGTGGGIYFSSGTGTINLQNTIIAENLDNTNAAPDLNNTTAATQPTFNASFLLVGKNTGTTLLPSALVGTGAAPLDPLLGPLAGNGGPTATHELLLGSPAINAGNPAAIAGVGTVPLYDQRGNPFDRVLDGRLDIGAFEFDPPPSSLDVYISFGELVIVDSVAPAGLNNNVTLRQAGNYIAISAVDNVIGFPFAIPGAIVDAPNMVRVPLAAITNNRVVVDLRGGNDVLNIDVSGGLLDFANGIWFDAGVGFDALNILQAGGPVNSSEALIVGSTPGSGRHLLVGGGATQTVDFFHIEPFTTNAVAPSFNITSVPGIASLLQDDNQITYLPSSILANGGRIEADDFEPIEFVNKQNLIIDAGSGDDTIVALNSATPTGLTSITINADAGNDTIRLEALPASPFSVTANGNSGNDILDASSIATNTPLILNGGTGNDILTGGAGTDTISGGADDDILIASPGNDTLDGGTGDDVVRIVGRILADVITANQSAATTLEVNYNGNARSYAVPAIELVIIDAGLGDDLVAVNVTDLLAPANSLPFEIIGNSPNASDRLIVNDDGLGDLVIHRESPDGRSGSITVGQFAPVVYQQVERVDITPLNAITGGTGNDGLGQLSVFEYDTSESNDSLATALPLGGVPVFLGQRNIDPGGIALPPPFPQVPGDSDWYEFRPGKIGTFRFEVLFEEIATLANGRAGLPGNGDLGIEVYRANGTLIVSSNAIGIDNESLDVSMAANTSYYLRVFGSTADAINVYDLNVTEIDLLGPQLYDPDGAGPLNAIHITDNPATAIDESLYDLFNPKASDGPTFPIDSLTIHLRDLLTTTLLRRAPGDVYAALDFLVAQASGNYQLVGDNVGLVPISSAVVTNAPPTIAETVSVGVSTTQFFAGGLVGATVQPEVGDLILFTDGTNGGLMRTITAYDPVTGLITIDAALPAAPAAADKFTILKIATATVELQFANPLTDDRYTLTILDGVVDPPQNRLDGEANATLPSGNGISGGNFVARFTVDTAAELGTWSGGSVYLDLNGNFVFDPHSGDAASRDVAATLGFTTDYIFAGNFVEAPNGIANGYDKLALYGVVNGQYRWLFDFSGTLTSPLTSKAQATPITGTPVAGNFDGIASNGDEIGIFTGTSWIFDNNRNFTLDDVVRTSAMRGLPVVGDFDGQGADDLATWDATTNTFQLSLTSLGGGPANPIITSSFKIGNGFPFLGTRERPVAGDLDGDGLDELGLYVPDRSGVPAQEIAEWYFFSSKDPATGNSVGVGNRTTRFEFGSNVLDFIPKPFGYDIFAQFGDEYALPIVGNFDPPGATSVPNPLPLPGDYDLDDAVTISDRGVWVSSFGSTTHLAADGNADNRINAADFVMWRDHLGAAQAASAAAGIASASLSVTDAPPVPEANSALATLPSATLDRVFAGFGSIQNNISVQNPNQQNWSNNSDLLLLLAERSLPTGEKPIAFSNLEEDEEAEQMAGYLAIETGFELEL